MPKLFNPSAARAAARGLRVVAGESSAAARSKALRMRGSHSINREFTLIDSRTGAEQPFRSGPGSRFSARKTAEQAVRAEALKRHAGELVDPRSWSSEHDPYTGLEDVPASALDELAKYTRDRLPKGAYGERKDVRGHFEKLSEQEQAPVSRLRKRRPNTEGDNPFARGFPREMTDDELRTRGLDPADYEPPAELLDRVPTMSAEERAALLDRGLHAVETPDFTTWDPDSGPPPGMTAEGWERFRREAYENRPQPDRMEPQGPHEDLPSPLMRELYPDLYRGGEEARYQRGMERSAERSAEEEALARVKENIERSRHGYGPLPTKVGEGALLDAFEQKYGWRPKSRDEALNMLSPADLEELGFDPNL